MGSVLNNVSKDNGQCQDQPQHDAERQHGICSEVDRRRATKPDVSRLYRYLSPTQGSLVPKNAQSKFLMTPQSGAVMDDLVKLPLLTLTHVPVPELPLTMYLTQ